MFLAQATQTRVRNVSFIRLKQGKIISSNQVRESQFNKVESSEKTGSGSDRAILHLMSTQDTTRPILVHPCLIVIIYSLSWDYSYRSKPGCRIWVSQGWNRADWKFEQGSRTLVEQGWIKPKDRLQEWPCYLTSHVNTTHLDTPSSYYPNWCS